VSQAEREQLAGERRVRLLELTTVYVSAAHGPSGFVSPDAKDSAPDLTEALRTKRGLRLVNDRAKADVWIRVDKRFPRNTGGSVAVGAVNNPTVTATAIPLQEAVVLATLRAGDDTTELAGATGWTWKAAAGQLADQVQNWVKENKARLAAVAPVYQQPAGLRPNGHGPPEHARGR
jgi:hypothetical protein